MDQVGGMTQFVKIPPPFLILGCLIISAGHYYYLAIILKAFACKLTMNFKNNFSIRCLYTDNVYFFCIFILFLSLLFSLKELRSTNCFGWQEPQQESSCFSTVLWTVQKIIFKQSKPEQTQESCSSSRSHGLSIWDLWQTIHCQRKLW